MIDLLSSKEETKKVLVWRFKEYCNNQIEKYKNQITENMNNNYHIDYEVKKYSEYKKLRKHIKYWDSEKMIINEKNIIRLLGFMFDKVNNKVCKNCSSSCCGNCKTKNGYIINGIRDKSLDEIKEKYGFGKYGFWDKKRGCKLPRNYMSHTCLTYHCDSLTKNILTDYFTFDEIGKKLDKLTYLLGHIIENIGNNLKSIRKNEFDYYE